MSVHVGSLMEEIRLLRYEAKNTNAAVDKLVYYVVASFW